MIDLIIITGSRAEFGLLRKLIILIKEDNFFSLKLIVTGSHLSIRHGYTIQEIKDSKIEIYSEININTDSDDSEGISKSTAIGIEKFSTLYRNLNPDLIMILGDRYEILAAALPAYFSRIPIAHIHGGEVTEGAIDEGIRHSLTKYSSLHFVANETYRKRVIQLGEHPETVFNVGGLGIDSILGMKLLNIEQLKSQLGVPFMDKLLLITYHPTTLSERSGKEEIEELLKSLSQLQDTTLIFTMPNSDIGNKIIGDSINKFVSHNKNAHSFESLGQMKYLSLVRYANAVIGNSSSGLLEVPSFNTATINIGNRQKGRMKAESVIDCECNKKSIDAAIETIYSESFNSKLQNIKNPYGEAGASKKIITILKRINIKTINQKSFFDL